MTDVARVAGVSHQTVSRVLNQKGTVRPETRDRVLQAIADLGYRRNEFARALASNSSRLIGIVTPRFENFGPATTLLSVQLAANEKGYMVSVATLPEFSPETLRSSIDDFLSLGVAGLIIITPVEGLALGLEAYKIPVPTLAIASGWVNEKSSIPRIGVDQRGGIHSALEHLQQQGVTSVGFVAGPNEWFDAREREAGWRSSLERLGLTVGPRIQGDWSAKRGRIVAQELAEGTLPDGIVVANDQTAFGMLQAFAELGVRVPQDLLLLGFDDEEASAFLSPALTTVQQDFRLLGFKAIDMLTRLMQGDQVENQMLPTQLKVRESA